MSDRRYTFHCCILSFLFIPALASLMFPGCAVVQSLGGLGSGESVNYALAINGATVYASDYTSNHPPATAINGITSSEGWDEGEGWECRFDRRHPRREGWSRLDPKTTMEYGSAWLEVQFDGPKLVNKVTIYTLNSPEYPAARYGIKDAWLQLWKEYGWVIVGEIRDSAIASLVSLEKQPAGGKMVFKLDPTETQKIRFVVLRSNDVKTIGQGWRGDDKSERSVARVVEIEVTGIGQVSGGSAYDDPARVREAPDFALQDMQGQWVRLSNFRSKVVIVTFWAAWSSESKRQVNDLKGLYNEYKDQGVAAIGISVDEGGAERIRSFVEASNFNYPILIADTRTKTAYGGIGKLPSTFIIDQRGNIYKEYFEYRGKHILELDIRRLLLRK